MVVPVAAGLREHGEQGECEEQHLGSHVCSSLQLQELVLVATGVSLLLCSSSVCALVGLDQLLLLLIYLYAANRSLLYRRRRKPGPGTPSAGTSHHTTSPVCHACRSPTDKRASGDRQTGNLEKNPSAMMK